MKQQESWNQIHKSMGKGRPPVDDWLDQFDTILQVSRDTPILDIGCGFGNDTLYLTEKGYRVISCDYVQAALNRLKYFIKHPKTKRFDMRFGLPFHTSSAKIIIADLSLHYFSAAATKRIIGEISRVLVDGGHLLCRVNSVHDVNHGAGQGIKIEENYYDINGKRKRFFNMKQIDCFFVGWEIISARECEMNRYEKPKMLWELALKNKK